MSDGNRDELRPASIHFQILAAGTLIFVASFTWLASPWHAPNGGDMQMYANTQAILNGIWVIGIYVAFALLVIGNGLLRNVRKEDA